MTRRTTRRGFLRNAALAGTGFWLAGRSAYADSKSPNEKLNVGVIGVAGRGGGNLAGVSSENIVALCDIDDQRLGKAGEQFPHAKKYHDFRKLLEQTDIDAVVVSTPDHTHAPASVAAMRLGKQVYCEKPLAHSVYEVRVMTETAAKQRVATQMGNQLHSDGDAYRRAVQLLQAGSIGEVREVHSWCDRGFSGGDRPKETPPVPEHIRWDLWLGPAPERPYHPCYVPFHWRGWWDFGTGSLGDMACHIMDVPFWALKLRYPTRVEAEGPPVHPESTPRWCIVRYEFPARGELPPVKLTWYDGGKQPPEELCEGVAPPGNGSLFIGSKGKLLVPHGGTPKLLPETAFADFKEPDPFLPRSPGHHREWILACKTGTSTGSNFDYAGPLAEAVLLGNVAYRSGEKLQWDAANLKATGCPAADAFIRREYRKGWSL